MSGLETPVAGLEAPAWGGFDPARADGGGAADILRSFRVAVQLGWKMEANWTDPILFFIYSVAKPVSSALILVLMLEVIGGGGRVDYRSFVVVGSALWAFVISGFAGMAWVVLDDRERYRMLRYIYVSPSDFIVVLIGRGVARLAVGAMGSAITLAVGVVALGVPFEPARIDWPLLVVVSILGLGAILALGMLLAAVCLQTRQESWSYPEAVAGALFLISGAVFPLSILPVALQAVGLLNPFAWWVEGARAALFRGGISGLGGSGSFYAQVAGHASPSGFEIVVALLATGTVATLASIAVFRASDRRAKDRGLIDQTTGS
jgi:ABC-2 type transport system permease protein